MSNDLTLLHNPRCSKSRQALALLQDAGLRPEVVRYLEEPLTIEALDALCTKLDLEPSALIRWRDAAAEGISPSDVSGRAAGLAVMARYPKLMERPVLIRGDRAVIARPPERVHELLDS